MISDTPNVHNLSFKKISDNILCRIYGQLLKQSYISSFENNAHSDQRPADTLCMQAVKALAMHRLV